jgi:hypothetical protein
MERLLQGGARKSNTGDRNSMFWRLRMEESSLADENAGGEKKPFIIYYAQTRVRIACTTYRLVLVVTSLIKI